MSTIYKILFFEWLQINLFPGWKTFVFLFLMLGVYSETVIFIFPGHSGKIKDDSSAAFAYFKSTSQACPDSE